MAALPDLDMDLDEAGARKTVDWDYNNYEGASERQGEKPSGPDPALD